MINNSNTEKQIENTIIYHDVKRRWPELYDGRAIKVPNGDSLIRHFGPDKSGLCFIINDDNKNVRWVTHLFEECGYIETIDGVFWISKAGTSCFRPSEEGRYRLIVCDHNIFATMGKDDIIKMNTLYVKKTVEKVFVILKKEENNND